MSGLRPHSQFDARRFRMNVLVDTTEVGFLENDWMDSVSFRVRVSTSSSSPLVLYLRTGDGLMLG